MKPIVYFLALFSSMFAPLAVSAREVIEVGQTVPEMCWKDADAQETCLSGHASQVRVLIYSTGWCPACNAEMDELVPRLPEVAELPVVFLSLSAQGDSGGAEVTPEFLRDWKERHAIPFPVLASPRDPGKVFFNPPFAIPSVVIVGRDGKLIYKEVGPEVETILEEARRAANASL